MAAAILLATGCQSARYSTGPTRLRESRSATPLQRFNTPGGKIDGRTMPLTPPPAPPAMGVSFQKTITLAAGVGSRSGYDIQPAHSCGTEGCGSVPTPRTEGCSKEGCSKKTCVRTPKYGIFDPCVRRWAAKRERVATSASGVWGALFCCNKKCEKAACGEHPSCAAEPHCAVPEPLCAAPSFCGEGCGSRANHSTRGPRYRLPQNGHRPSPLARPMYDPFAEGDKKPATRPYSQLKEAPMDVRKVPAQPEADSPVPNVPSNAPNPPGFGVPSPADNVPDQQPGSTLDPVPDPGQTSTNPAPWPRLRYAQNNPFTETAWSSAWQSR